MNRTTEELLNALLWLASAATKPTLRNLIDGSDRFIAHQQIDRLQKAELVSKQRDESGEWVLRLTEIGRIAALGGRNPDQAWSRRWDGRWRMILFDIPKAEASLRKRLHRWLHSSHFGCLQNSVWITPDPLDAAIKSLGEQAERVGSIVIVEGSPLAGIGTSPAGLAETAWDFDEINRRYDAFLQFASGSQGTVHTAAWRRKEHEAWTHAVKIDPLLPDALLPRGYRGRRAWKRHLQILKSAP